MYRPQSPCLKSLACGLLLFLVVATSHASLAQDVASPVVLTARPLLFSAPGVSSAVLVSEDIGSLPGESVSLHLEKITLPSGALLPSQQSDGPVQLLVLEGDILLQDAFGFSAPFTADEGTTIVAGEAYDLQNESSSDAVVLRLRLAGGSGSAEASPGDGESAPAAPVEIEPVFSADLAETLPDPASLFIGRATWEPGADSGTLEHTGPVGLYVTSGQLSATSPSGIEGLIDAEDAVVIPSTTPLEARNPEDEPATAILFGLFETGNSIFTVQVSLATPTPGLIATPETGTMPVLEVSPDAALQATPATTPTARVVSPPTDEVVVALPTATSEIQSVAESATEPVPDVLTFSYSDWVSGWRQDSDTFYGRPWTVVYGALSQHPRATLSFTLDSQPADSAVLEVTGLDDEWAGNSEIEVLVNGSSVYEGPSSWLSYEGNAANFSDAPWTTAEFAIPSGLLTAGSNTIVIANLEPAANFGSPPYILLSDTTLQFNSES